MVLKILDRNQNVCEKLSFMIKYAFFVYFILARQFKYINEHELFQMKQEEGK